MRIIPLTELPLIDVGDDVVGFLLKSMEAQGLDLEDGDVLVIAQTVVSKSEGSIVDLSSIDPSSRAREIAEKIGEKPKQVEVILDQTDEIVRLEHVIISRTKHGFVCANAGVDSSNVESGKVTVLPENPDESAREIRKRLKKETGKDVAVIISDSWGRPFRLGAVGFAIGSAGIKPLEHLKGRKDAYGGLLKTTTLAPPDSLAAAASLEMGEADEGVPAAIIKDAPYTPGEGSIRDISRPLEEDLFR